MDPIRFAFGLHLHQPVGNFDSVFEEHVRDVYLPFLDRVTEREFFPLVLHISGPLLEWLEAHDAAYLDQVGRLVTDGKLELLLAGMYEPVLVSLPRADRVEQIGWMREALERRFGIQAKGLWLTERVWEPELAADLAEAGVTYALVDDRHFLAAGFTRRQLHTHFQTESDGKHVALFPIDERLRYLIPFRPPAETAAYLREMRQAGHRLAVLADDGEKFGGWPGTREWVYDKGWLQDFLETMGGLLGAGEVRLSTLSDALEEITSGGLAYLPTCSYREMEGWSLPTEAAVRFAALEHDIGPDRRDGPDGAMIRGSHWRNFFVKYSESNRMHKKMQALSMLARAREESASVRRAIGRSQCNDAYWHGVFGGLYLPHLRDAIWRELALAESGLREGESLAWEALDIDGDGQPEIWVHSAYFSAIIAPHRGGAIEELTVFSRQLNFANTLRRRREAYHLPRPAEATHAASGTPSIHDLEESMRLNELPPMDQEERGLFVDRILSGDLELPAYERGDYDPLWSAATRTYDVHCSMAHDGIDILLQSIARDPFRIEKRYRFHAEGTLTVDYRWDPRGFPENAIFAPEISLADPLELILVPAASVWKFDIATMSKSERGFDDTMQGESLTPRWALTVGEARIEVDPG
ncbi:MAG: alpha-amylase/4-alpha-glucanotransferase domain-containing protein [Gemmatimonadota bacterium]